MPRWLFTVLLSGAAAAGGFALWRLPAGALVPKVLLPEGDPAAPISTGNACFDLTAALDRPAVPPDGGVDRMLVVTVTGRAGCGAERLPLDLALVVDVSGSMRDDHKLEDAQAAAVSLLDHMRVDDHVTLVSFSDGARVWGTADATDELPRSWVRGLRPEGGTNLQEGLEAGIGALAPNSDRLRRVLVLTDGHANRGLTRAEELAPLLGRRDDVTVSTVGLGPDYNELLLGALAQAGHGSFHHAETRDGLVAAYTRELSDARHVAARGIQLRIAPPAGGSVTAMAGGFAIPDGTGALATLGDLAAGETRSVVLRVHTATVSPGVPFTIEASGRRPGSADTLSASATASPRVDVDPAAWDAHDGALAVAIARAEAAEDLARARDEYASGQDDAAQRRLESRSRALGAVYAQHPDAAGLAPLAETLEEVTTAPTAALKEKRAYASSQRLAH